MKKTILSALAIAFLLFIAPDISAQLISPEECPSGVCTKTAPASSKALAATTVINIITFFAGMVLIPAGVILFILGIVIYIRFKLGKSKKSRIWMLITGPLLIIIPIIIFAIINTVIQVGAGPRPV